MFGKLFMATALGLAAAAVSATEIPPLPVDALETSDARVQAHYRGQCATWGQEQNISGAPLSQFLSECQQLMAELRPVGFESGGGGSE